MQIEFVNVLSLILFSIGLYGVMVSNIGIKMLISIEILLNAAILSLIGAGILFNSSSPLVFALFVIAIGVVESVIGMSLMAAIYRKYGKISISLIREIKW